METGRGGAVDFDWSGCGARYKVVRVPAVAGLPDHLIHCTVCNRRLAATDDENNMLKYFLTKRPGHEGSKTLSYRPTAPALGEKPLSPFRAFGLQNCRL